ncbi:MAG: FtsW/RodA/SpoVE family cell cycle protein, partial [Anaerolineae bacterium]|nr:FtsW/RodA/SpoVE family cell cycle protein [Anaerolineae bacterium]
YIAVWLEARGKDLRNITLGLVPFAVLLGVIAGLVAVQPDFSTAVLLVGTATAMFFVAGADIKQLLIGFLVGGVALALVALAAGYRYVRIVDWWRGPLSDPRGGGFQTVQALVALNRGHWLGVGFGQSEQKYAIYAPHSDCIFAIIGEELGFLGALAVIILYALWTWRGLRIAFRAPDDYGMLLAVGLVSWVTLQAALHISALTALTPFTGTVLPFVSYGGSSLTSCLASVGILLNISQSRAEEGRQT